MPELDDFLQAHFQRVDLRCVGVPGRPIWLLTVACAYPLGVALNAVPPAGLSALGVSDQCTELTFRAAFVRIAAEWP